MWRIRGRTVLAAVLLLHFVVLALNALPDSRFVAALFPYYGFYPRITRQQQRWAMYQTPVHARMDFELVARFPDGREERPWGSSADMSARQVYFLEALLYTKDREKLARSFLQTLRQRWRSQPLPQTLTIRRRTIGLNTYADVPKRGAIAGAERVLEVSERW